MDVAVGEYTYGHNIGKTHKNEVLRRISDTPGVPMAYQYEVVLEVRESWQAQAIAVILNAK